MALPSSSLLVTPGAGATLATHLVSGKEYEVVMPALIGGHIEGSEPLYLFHTGNPSPHVAAASTLWMDLFNNGAAGTVIRVRSIVHTIIVEGAVAGVGLRWQILRSTSAGTGGTALTNVRLDTGDPVLDTGITARQKASGGAGAGASVMWYNRHTEESTVVASHPPFQEVLPPIFWKKGLVLRVGEGVRINQESNSAVGNSVILIGFQAQVE